MNVSNQIPCDRIVQVHMGGVLLWMSHTVLCHQRKVIIYLELERRHCNLKIKKVWLSLLGYSSLL